MVGTIDRMRSLLQSLVFMYSQVDSHSFTIEDLRLLTYYLFSFLYGWRTTDLLLAVTHGQLLEQ